MRNLYLLCLFLMVYGCNNDSSVPDEVNEETSSLSGVPDFDKFYYRFHIDSTFQLAHINFPLEGLPSHYGDSDIEVGTYKWTKDTWKHHSLITAAEFESKFQVLDETLITEYIIHERGEMGMMRRFSKSDDGWYLIYYAGMNPIEVKR